MSALLLLLALFICVVGWTVARARFFLYLFIISIPLESLIVLQGNTWSKYLGTIALASWLLDKVVHPNRATSPRKIQVLSPILLLLIITIVLGLQSASLSKLILQITTLAQLAIFCFLLVDSTESWKDLEVIAKSLLLGGCIAVILVLLQASSISLPFLPTASHSSVGTILIRRAGRSISGNENQTAVLIIAILPFAFYFIRGIYSKLWRLFGAIYLLLAPVAVVFTYSRLSIVMLVCVLGVCSLAIGYKRTSASRLSAGLMLILAIVLIIQFTPWEMALFRFDTLRAETSREDFSNRTFIWEAAVNIFSHSPIIGVGYGNFSSYAFYYLDNGSFGNIETPLIIAPHSSVLSILAESGLIGMIPWIMIVIVSLKHDLSNKDDNASKALLRQSTLFSLITLIIIGMMGTTHLMKILWLVLGMSETLWQLSLLPPDVSENSFQEIRSIYNRASLAQRVNPVKNARDH